MADEYGTARERMVRDQLFTRGIKDARVLETMKKVPRHLFIKKKADWDPYGDHPVPIGQDQTISQPYIVALMTEALELAGPEKTLEIGTGSGYQTAILAELSSQVHTVERLAPLLETARGILDGLGYRNIHYKAFDGTLGWPEHQPYDAIMVTAAGPHIPEALLDQLAEGGRLVIPVGNKFTQDLIKVTKKDGETRRRNLGGCRFVSLIGADGWKD
jgi:protein-L-isoaspartate(D-aspartate) O-methyltransferase